LLDLMADQKMSFHLEFQLVEKLLPKFLLRQHQ
jgi:hypothetical protein